MKDKISERKTKVLEIITRSDWAGAQRIVYEICKGIKEDFSEMIEVEVAMGGNGPLFRLLEELGVKTHRIDNLQRSMNLLSDIRSYRDLKRLIRESGYDVVHCHSSKAGVIGRLAAKRNNVENVIYTVHGWWGVTQFSGLKRNSVLFVERVMAKKTDKLVFVCNKDKKFAEDNQIGNASQYKVIVNQVTVPQYGRGKLRSMLDLSDSVKIVGNVARLSPQKNPIRFVEVAAEVLKSSSNTVFVWIGDGELMDQAIEHSKRLGIADKIRFIGFHQNGAELMADFDCLLMTSDDEGLPITVLEALAQGIPVVSTDVGGIPELLDSRWQVVSLEDSVETKLADTVLKVIEEPCKLFETETRTSQKMVEEYIALYMARNEKYDSSVLN